MVTAHNMLLSPFGCGGAKSHEAHVHRMWNVLDRLLSPMLVFTFASRTTQRVLVEGWHPQKRESHRP